MVIVAGVIMVIEHLLLNTHTHFCAPNYCVLSVTATNNEFLLETSYLQMRLRCLLRVDAALNTHFEHHLLLSQLLLLLLRQ